MSERLRPGPGWLRIGEAVWEHVSGIRLHTAGLVITPTGEQAWANSWPESKMADQCIRLAGGNRKRGLMIWALQKGGEG